MKLPLRWMYTPQKAEKEVKKRFWLRLPVWFFGGAGILLIDEYIKEGYLFHLSDIQYVGTHENMIITLVTLGFLTLLRDARKKGGLANGRDNERKSD